MRKNATIMTPANIAIAKKLLQPDRFGKRRSLAEVGAVFGVSREYIRQKCGNVGRRTQKRELAKYAADLRIQVYRNKLLTVEQVAEKFGCSVISVKNALGSKIAYERSIGLRECVECHEWKPFDQFYVCNDQPRNLCKPCDNRKAVAYMQTHREQVNALARERQRTPAYRAVRKAWNKQRWQDPVQRAKMLAKAKKYYYAHREELLAKRRKGYVIQEEK